MRTPIVLLCACLMLAGCAVAVPPLEPPAAGLMRDPKPLPDPKAGDDVVQLYAALRRESATDKSKLRRLQRYVRTVLGK